MTEDDFDVQYVERDDRSARVLIRGLTPGVRERHPPRDDRRRPDVLDRHRQVRRELLRHVRRDDRASTGAHSPEDAARRLRGRRRGHSRARRRGSGDGVPGDIESADPLVVEVADDNIPIIELKEGQRLEFEADAVLDTGKEHAKHQGGVSVGYRHLQRVSVEGDLGEFDDDEPRILRGVIETPDGEIELTDEFDNDLSERFPGKKSASRMSPARSCSTSRRTVRSASRNCCSAPSTPSRSARTNYRRKSRSNVMTDLQTTHTALAPARSCGAAFRSDVASDRPDPSRSSRRRDRKWFEGSRITQECTQG